MAFVKKTVKAGLEGFQKNIYDHTYLIQCTSCTSARNIAVHFCEWYFHILITEGDPVWAEAKISL